MPVSAGRVIRTLSRFMIQALLEPHFLEEPPVAAPPAVAVASAMRPVPAAEPPPAMEIPAPRPAPVADLATRQMGAKESPAVAAHDITELISAGDLAKPQSTDRTPLFDPDNPFNVGESADAGTRKKRSGGNLKKVLLALGAVAIIVAAGFVAPQFLSTNVTPNAPEMGTLVVQSNPPGVQVFVDGIDRGLTPARVSVTPGAHILELRGRGVPRVIPFNAKAGEQVSHHLEFANTPETGQLRVESQPAGAKVTVDGVARGVAPLTVAELLPGDHEVILETADASARHVVNVQAGGSASLVAPVGAAAAGGPVSGWLAVKAPFTLEIREGGRVVGTTDVDRIMLAAGRHELQLVNETLGYTASRVVTVQPGKVSTLTADLPNGTVNLQALPWAEVWIDGQRVGETPIGNLSVPIGPHEVLFRHPQYGEKRHAIAVTLGTPVRLSVDMK